jgi:hypothetical protein
MSVTWKKLAATASLAAAALLAGCSPDAQAPVPEQLEAVEPDAVSVLVQELTGQQIDTSAQRGVTWVVPDTVNWVKNTGNCAACHRVGAPLYGASQAAHTGYVVNTDATSGTGWLARFLVTEQLAGGNWIHAGAHHPFAKSGYAVFGLAGYTRYTSTQYYDNVRRAVDWALGATVNSTFTFALDGKPLGGVRSRYVPMDHVSYPVDSNWTVSTAQFAVATQTVLEGNNGLTPAQQSNYRSFLSTLADSLEGQYVRSNGAWQVGDIAYAVLGTTAAGRTVDNNASVRAMRDELLARSSASGAWSDPNLGGDNVFSTGQALYALCLSGVRSDTNTTVFRGLEWLATQQCSVSNNYCATGDATKDGSWSLPNHTADVPTIFATLAMGCYGTLNAQVTMTPATTQLAPYLSTWQQTQFTVTVKNTGYGPNTYNLSLSGSWPGMLLGQTKPTLTLQPNSSDSTVVTVRLPPNQPDSVVIPVTLTTTYDTSSGPAVKTSTFTIYIPNQPNVSAVPTTTQITSGNGAIVTPGTVAPLAARVYNTTGQPVTLGTLTFFSASAAIATVQADANGVFSYPWPVPSTAQNGPQAFSALYNGYATPNFSTNLAASNANGSFTVGNGQGAYCKYNSDCLSNFCADGVCCNTACGGSNPGDCQACSRMAGAAGDGTCQPVRAGFICRGSTGVCDNWETCNGSALACPPDDHSQTQGLTCGATGAACTTTGVCNTPATGIMGKYYNNVSLSGSFSDRRRDNSVNFNWGTSAPSALVQPDQFSVLWTGDVTAPVSGTFTFYTMSDEGVRLWVNGKRLIDNWLSHTSTQDSGTIDLVAGQRYSIRLEYYEGTGNAVMQLYWSAPGVPYQLVPQVRLRPAINNPVPTRITSPLDRTWYMSPATINVNMETMAVDGTLTQAELFVDGQSQQTLTAPPWRFTLTNQPAGTYVLSVRTTATVPLDSGTRTVSQFSQPVAITVMQGPAGTTFGSGLTADYFNGTGLSNFQFTRTDEVVNLTFPDGVPPAPGITANAYSVRWTGSVLPAYSEVYTFYTTSDNGVRLWVNNQLIIDNWSNPVSTELSGTIALTAGQPVPVRLEYFQSNGTARAQFLWASPSEPKSVVPHTRLFPATRSSF